MRGFVFGLVSLASCAELSGLSNLEIEDAGLDAMQAGDVPQNDAGGDVTDAVDAPSTGDVGAPDATLTFCQTLVPSMYIFCADFDEGSISSGYAVGKPASWTTISSSPPTLSTMEFVSAPASALCGGMNTFSYSPPSGTFMSIAVAASIQMMSAGMEPTTLYSIIENAMTLNGVLLIAQPGMAVGSYDLVVETVIGSTLTPHTIATALTLGTWHTVKVVVTSVNVTATVDKTVPQSYAWSASVPDNPTFTIGSSTAPWSGYFDNVLIGTQ